MGSSRRRFVECIVPCGRRGRASDQIGRERARELLAGTMRGGASSGAALCPLFFLFSKKKNRRGKQARRWMRDGDADADGECAALNHDSRTRQKWSHGKSRVIIGRGGAFQIQTNGCKNKQIIIIIIIIILPTKTKRWTVTRAAQRSAAAWTLGLDFLDGGHAAAGFTFGRRSRRTAVNANGKRRRRRKTVSLPAGLPAGTANATPAAAGCCSAAAAALDHGH